MSRNNALLSGLNEVEKPSTIGKVKKLALWFAGIFLTVFVGLILLRVLLVGGGERIESLHAFANSPWLLLFRIFIYVSLWFCWGKLLAMFIKNYNPELVRVTRRPLLVLLISYELFFATNVIGYLI